MERWHTRLRSLSLGFSFTLDEKPLKKGGSSPSHPRPPHGAVPAGHMDQGHYDDGDMSSANPSQVSSQSFIQILPSSPTRCQLIVTMRQRRTQTPRG